MTGFRFLMLLALSFSMDLAGQQYATFEIQGTAEACHGKFEEWKVKTSDDNTFPGFSDIDWEVQDFTTGVFNYQHTGKTFNFFVNYQPSTGVRVIKIRAKVTLIENGASVDYEDEIIVKIVHPHYYMLVLNSTVNCGVNTLAFNLEDPSGVLSTGNLQNITWEIPPDWDISSGSGTPAVIIDTYGDVEGKNKVKVKYEAARRKETSGGTIDFKKCFEKTSIEAEIDVTACVSTIPYTSTPANEFSHSAELTSFIGNITLPPNDYNYVSGGEIDVKESFDFRATSGNELNFFIEPCDCNSLYRDPGYIGDVNITFSDHLLGKQQYLEVGLPKVDNYSIDDSKANTIEVFPNPSVNEVTISGFLNDEELIINLLSSTGSVVLNSYSQTSSNGTVSLNMENLIAGIYTLVVYHEKGVHRQLIIKE